MKGGWLLSVVLGMILALPSSARLLTQEVQQLYVGADIDEELLQQLVERGKQVSCRWDWDCKKLDTIIPLKQPRCVGAIGTYYSPELTNTTSTSLKSKYYYGNYFDTILMGKHYTYYLQTGIKVEYKCGENGFCEVKKIDTEADGTKKKCTGIFRPGKSKTYSYYLGCLVDPVEYKGRTYQNICICFEHGFVEFFCKDDDKTAVFTKQVTWTCEIEERPIMLCGVGGVCKPTKRGAGCFPADEKDIKEILQTVGGLDPASADTTLSMAGIKIGIGPFDGLNGPFEIAAFDSDGNVIAKKPITAIPAVEYLQRYGPYRCSEGLEELAERTGLLAELREMLAERSLALGESDLHSLLAR